jgi:superfamily II DNA or RNA helicase
MPWKCEQVHEVRLRPARNQEEYLLHLAALEWSLAEPIVIDSAADIKSRQTWHDRLEPFSHQVQNLFTFCRRLPVLLLADDVGLGKTISAGLILSELTTRRRVSRTLILCPRILMPQWVEELDSKFAITATTATGAELDAEFRRQTPVVITTYDSARARLDQVEPGQFDMLILDEAHKVRNLYGTPNPPVMALRVREALEKRLFKYVVMLTATPLHNRLWDLYSLLDCLTVAKGHQNPLGSPEHFRDRYIVPGSDGRKVEPGRAEEFRSILRQYLVRTRRGDATLKFPDREVRVIRVNATPGEQRLTNLVAQHIEHLHPFLQISLAQALMSSPQALAAQMENMAGRSITPAAATEARRIADSITETGKLIGLMHSLKELRQKRAGRWRAVVFTLRKETQRVIGEALEKEGIPYGYIRGGEGQQNYRTIKRFRTDPPEINVIVSTDAGAEGINLQVANFLVNYDLPWNPMIVEQRIGRIQRLASSHEYVIICNLVVAGSVEERVVGRLMEKLQLISHAIGDIEAILESAGCEGETDDEGSFEGIIRDLVVKSLIGQNVEEATRRAQESIQIAKRHLEEQREVLDDTLGRLDALHRAGPTMPKLKPVAPSVPAKEFVLRAKRAQGAKLEPLDNETYEVEIPGLPRELITFDEAVAADTNRRGVFMGRLPQLYLPGRPPFERLTQHWVDHYGHHVRDLPANNSLQVQELGRSWCRTIAGADFIDATFTPTEAMFQGSATLRVRAGNAVDSYEKLIRGKLLPKDHRPIPSYGDSKSSAEAEILPSEIQANIKPAVGRAVEKDNDVGKFCQFYEARLREETEKAGQDPRRLRKIEGDFKPAVFAEIVGLEGARYHVGKLSVRFSLQGATYDAALEAIPVTAQILREPDRQTCAVTNLDVPDACLGVCEITRSAVLKHLLKASEISGRLGLAEHLVSCPLSGKKVLSDEMESSDVSGLRAAANLFLTSPISGRRGLTEEFGKCEFTGTKVLSDEIVQSQVSGKRFRADEQLASVVSGTLGHKSEFIACQRTGHAILPSEAERSAVSGLLVRKDLLQRSAKPPGRLGLADEMVQCASTEQWLLSDEVGRSAVSGKWFDRDLLQPSGRSGKLAHTDELITCEETGARLLPEETGTCAITGKRVDLRSLARSEASGTLALACLMQRCAKTQKHVLPSELVECDRTKLRALPGELEFCSLTGQRILRDRLLKSDESGRYVVPEQAIRSEMSEKIGLPDEVIECSWSEKRILKSEGGICRITGCLICRAFLNDAGELQALRQALDGSTTNLTKADELVPWLVHQREGNLKGLRHAWCVASPSSNVVGVCGDLRSMFGLRRRIAGGLMVLREPRSLLGRWVVGYRTNLRWIEESGI